MFIEDDELRDLYKSSSAEHIQTIEDGLLQLEKDPQDATCLEALLRSAHSLKGDSRMLGVVDVESITHHIEEILQGVSKGERTVDSDSCDLLYKGLDAIRKIADEAITGNPSGVPVLEIVSELMAESGAAPSMVPSNNPMTPELGGLFGSSFGDDATNVAADEFSAASFSDDSFSLESFSLDSFAEASFSDEPSDVPDLVVPDTSASDAAALAAASESTSAYIDDDELRDLYKTSSADHIQTIEDGLLHLEKNPQDSDRLEVVLRSTHSLKGDSRMLGVLDVESIVHQIEEQLQAVQQGNQQLTSALCERLYVGIDAMRKISHEAITGEPSNIQAFFIVAQLMEDSEGALPSEAQAATAEIAIPAPAPADSPAVDDDMARLEQEWLQQLKQEEEAKEAARTKALAAAPVAQAAGSKPSYTIDTIRVPAAKLDTLVAQISELSVTRTRFAGRLGELDSLTSLWEEWKQDALAGRAALDELEERLPESELHHIRKFYSDAEQYLEELGSLTTRIRQTAYEDTARLEIFTNQIESNVQNLRLLPLASVFSLFPRMVRDISKQQGKQIELIIEGEDTLADKQIVEEIKDPLIHLIRNAIDHGLESPEERSLQGKPEKGTIRLRGFQVTDSIGIELIDDGRGLNLDGIRKKALQKGLHTEGELQSMEEDQLKALIFSSGFSTRDTVSSLSGRGVGLDVVRSNIEEKLKGSIRVDSTPGQGCHFRITVNPSLARTYALLVSIGGTTYAIPAESVHSMMMLSPLELFGIEGHQTTTFEGQPLSINWLTDLLGLPFSRTAESQLESAAQGLNCVVLQSGSERLGVLVDELIDRQSIVLKSQNKILTRVRNVTGATILGNGEVCIVLNPADLISTGRGGSRSASIASDLSPQTFTSSKRSLLLVEDSIIIRTQMIRLLKGAGYEVTAAVDGADGLKKLQEGRFDAVVSDVEMPNLDGLGMTSRIRQMEEYDELPILLITTLASEADRRRGAEAGANAYLTKGDFDQDLLFQTLDRLM